MLVDLAYNAGVDGALGFHKALEAMRTGDWATAAREIEASSLSPRRAQALAAIVGSIMT